MSCKLLSVCFLLTIIYIFMGAPIFWVVEHENELSNQKLYRDLYNKTLDPTIPTNASQLNNLLQLVANNPQLVATENDTYVDQWDLYGSLFFSLVVISTIGKLLEMLSAIEVPSYIGIIGFGNQVPVTPLGQRVVCLYALFGVPLFLYTMTQVSEETKLLIHKFGKCLPRKIKKLKHFIIAAFAIVNYLLVFMMAAGIFKSQEDWTFQQSMYFCFIALCTIGFGDYVPGTHNPSRVYKVFILVWLLVGLTYVATIFGWFQTLIDKLLKHVGVRCTKKKVQRTGTSPPRNVKESAQ